MKKSVVLSVLAFSCALPAASQLAGRVELRTFTSSALGIEKAYNIYLPPGYDGSTARYPVVYFFRGHEREWFNATEDGSRNGRTLKDVADELSAAGLIGPMILVGPNNASADNSIPGLGVNMLRPDLAPTSGIGTGKFEDYIVQDLIPHIDSTFRTIADRGHRGIDGFSYGGFTVANLSSRHPGLFVSAGAYDATLMWYDFDDPRGVGPNDDFWLLQDPTTDPLFDNPRNVPYMLTYNAANNIRGADSSTLSLLQSMHFFIQSVNSEGNLSRNQQWVSILGEKGIKNGFADVVLRPNAIHNWFNADLHATASLQKHWQVFAGSRMFVRTYVEFSGREIGQSDTVSVSVKNISPDPLSVTGILLTGGQQGYSTPDLPGLPHLLSSENDSITFRIVFSPTGLGEFLDTLMVLDDDTTGNMLSSIVHGKGVLIARADAGLLYALGATPGGEALYTLDSTAGTATLHTGIDVSGFVDAAVRGVDTTVYGIVPSSLSSDVYKISTGGSAVKSVSVPVGNLRALAFSPGDTLFAGSANGGFYRIDRVTGSASLLGTMPGLDYSGLAFEPSSGILWASARHPIDSIYTVNTANGSATFVGTTGFNALTASLAFSPSGTLYGLIDNGTGENYLAVISTVNGAGTLIGPTVAGDLSAIAIVPPLTGPLAVQQPRDGDLPASYHLFQNYPNPFNPETSIEYTVGVSGQQSAVSLVRLRVYDVLGREVARLVNEEKTPGTYTAKFDGSDLSSGLYFYRLESGSFSSTRKMLLLR